MPVPAVVPDPLRRRPFRGTAAISRGLLTRAQLRSSPWRRLFRDVYAHQDLEPTHELRIQAAALLYPHAVVSGRSAAVLWEVPLAGPDDDVELSSFPGATPVRTAGIRMRRADLEERHVLRHAGMWVASPEATAVELAGGRDLDDAVAAVDQLVVLGGADLTDVRRLADAALGPGCRRARQACALADGKAESPQETRLRLLIGRSDLPTPVAQYRVRAGSRFVAKVDFGWPEHRVAVEYDGLWHNDPRQFVLDRQRLNRLTAAGWRVVFVTAADLHRRDQLIARIARALTTVVR
ncbi:endonuclease domain-containing protein [Modestobacter marinus]|uniref:endonuclease domain-containing protein n=1 Tax=Modestobacter marinus TaxID=477641 RepID=UPI001C968008|nr:endonuclease domain-containing protein [Modestobacter marinus]